MFRIFEEVTGIDYPYNKYDQTMVADFQFGGMENITATTMADSEILMARFVFARPLVEDLVSHELSHSWFGNLVTCRNWSELWLNEGFATYMEAVFREKMYGRANYIEKIESDASEFFTYISLREESQHALFNKLANPQNDDTLFTPITYQKGSVVIHMLREEIGDEAFWKGINVYLNRFKFANVETPDLQNVLEEVSGKKLDWFFKQWVYQTGFPKLNVQPLYNQKQKILTLNFSQIQKGNEDMPKEFTLPLEIEILSSNGKETKQILVNKKLQSFAFPVTSKPQKITIDKNYKIPLKDLRQSKLIIKN
jgi:aminopeptidase N